MSNLCVWLAYCYFMFFADIEVGMKRNKLEKILYVFKTVGIMAGAVLAVIHIVKELVSILWAEWADKGVFEYTNAL